MSKEGFALLCLSMYMVADIRRVQWKSLRLPSLQTCGQLRMMELKLLSDLTTLLKDYSLVPTTLWIMPRHYYHFVTHQLSFELNLFLFEETVVRRP